MTAKKPKLPNVWVVFGDSAIRGTWLTKEAAESVCLKTDVPHRYAPVLPPKVCRWTRRLQSELLEWATACGYFTDGRYKFCPNCGGKIKVAK